MQQKLEWSIYQRAIFENVEKGTGHTVVIARAGSAKTSSLVESVKYIPKKKSTLFVAFNKKIAEELDERINKSYIDTRTLHSFGYRTVLNAFGKTPLDPDKTKNIIEKTLHSQGYKKFDKEKFGIINSMDRTVSLCKGTLIDTPSKIDLLMDRFDIDIFDMERDTFVKTVCSVLRQCKEAKSVVDYGDMVWFPFVYNLNCQQYDRVFIDECQDLTAAQLHLALAACKKDGRILAAGDDFQVLYQFTGVELNTIDLMVKKLSATVLTLPISYRCAKTIIKMAQNIVPDIEAAPNAKEGTITTIPEKNFLLSVKPGDFILSRLNAPLIYHCLALLRMGVSANIQGRDLGASLAYMVKKSEAKTVPDFIKWLSKWKAAEVDRLTAKGRDPVLVLDKADCLETLCEGATSTEEVLDNIKVLFNDGDDTNRVMLSTVHRAKGLERDRVFMLMKTFKQGMSREENNIIYVATTRSKTELFLVVK